MPDASTDRGSGLGGFRRFTWWSLAGTTTFLLAVLVGVWILDPDVPVWSRLVSAPALAVTVVAGTVLLTRRLEVIPSSTREAPPGRLPGGWAIAGGVAAAVLGAVILATGNVGLWSIPPAVMVAAIATYMSSTHRWTLIASAALASAAVGALGGLATEADLPLAIAFPPAMVGSFAWVTLGILWAWDLAERLTQARRLAAELAIKDERLRFAADLHDIQGHHLQVIALKSELAARLADTDPDRAAAEMKEVQRLATDALEDTRAVVQGYRRTTLDEEIANATKVLAAADIETQMNLEAAGPPGAARLPAASRHLLGLVMRETATNVLRHSRARHADVDYALTDGVARLRVRNDGVVGPSTTGTGTGLAGLAERLSATGGSLTWRREDEWFVVTASVPVGVDGEAAE